MLWDCVFCGCKQIAGSLLSCPVCRRLQSEGLAELEKRAAEAEAKLARKPEPAVAQVKLPPVSISAAAKVS